MAGRTSRGKRDGVCPAAAAASSSPDVINNPSPHNFCQWNSILAGEISSNEFVRVYQNDLIITFSVINSGAWTLENLWSGTAFEYVDPFGNYTRPKYFPSRKDIVNWTWLDYKNSLRETQSNSTTTLTKELEETWKILNVSLPHFWSHRSCPKKWTSETF